MQVQQPAPAEPAKIKFNQTCCVRYRNWRGEERVRLITPVALRFGSTEWHPEPQWLVDAYDNEAAEPKVKAFSLNGITEVLA